MNAACMLFLLLSFLCPRSSFLALRASHLPPQVPRGEGERKQRLERARAAVCPNGARGSRPRLGGRVLVVGSRLPNPSDATIADLDPRSSRRKDNKASGEQGSGGGLWNH